MADLPSGVVTFLFTDIEGSTRLWERDHDAMWTATARHNAILSAQIADHRGHHFKTIGDAYLAAFADPADAVAAAVASQRALAAELWDETGPIRVRMAIHMGDATPAHDDYVVAPCLNRLARLLSTGYGAQVLLSDVVRRAVTHRLPEGVTLRDLGRHRLRDLLEPELVSQIVAPDLPDTFPPLKSLERHPTNLPIQPTPLVGREEELETVRTLLLRDDVRLVTLTGVGGTGKTRLALQAAAEALETFEDGAFFVDLAPIEQPQLVLSTIAAALGVRESGGRSLRDALVDHLAEKHLLLVLDNFEHVLAAAPDVTNLIRSCAHLTVLVTSRASLRLRGEHEVRIPPLAVPDPRKLPPLEELAVIEAVDLFSQRAAAIRPGFALADANAQPVAEICARLDGIPLAIELAAARLRTLEPAALLGRLDRRLKVLTGGARDLADRQQTLRATIAWSHDLLPPDEQALFRRLSVFTGSGSIDAAEQMDAIASDLDIDVLDGIEALIDQSLLRRLTGPDDEPRFGMLETLREFAQERLEQAGETGAMQQALAAWYVRLTDDVEDGLRGPGQAAWLRRLDTEHDNLRAVLGHALTTDDTTLALRLTRRLWPFWRTCGFLEEGVRWIDATLAASGEVLEPDVLWARIGGGSLRFAQGDFEGAEAWFDRAFAEAETLGDRRATMILLNNLGAVAHMRGNLDTAAQRYEQSLAFAREVGDDQRHATALLNLGAIAHYQGDTATAIGRYEESLALYRALGDTAGTMDVLSNLVAVMAPVESEVAHARRLGEEALALARELGTLHGEASILTYLGIAAETAGELDRAWELHDGSLRGYREVGDRAGVASALGNLGAVALARSDLPRAVELSAESAAIFGELGDPDGVAFALDTLAAVLLDRADAERAARWWGASDGLRERAGSAPPEESRRRRERFIARIHATLPRATIEASIGEGRAIDMDALLGEIAATCARLATELAETAPAGTR